jgi:hypothetical protein
VAADVVVVMPVPMAMFVAMVFVVVVMIVGQIALSAAGVAQMPHCSKIR